MKTKLCLICGIIFSMVSCEHHLYYVPDNFPKETFFSYLPYEQGQEVLFCNQIDTIRLTVYNVEKSYLRGERTCDCGVENALASVELLNDTMGCNIVCQSLDRTIFSISLYDQSKRISQEGGNEILLDEYSHRLNNQSDEIFNQFVEDIVMLNGAIVKQNIGLVSFMDKYGTEWTLME